MRCPTAQRPRRPFIFRCTPVYAPSFTPICPPFVAVIPVQVLFETPTEHRLNGFRAVYAMTFHVQPANERASYTT